MNEAAAPASRWAWATLLPVLACFGLAIWQMRFEWWYEETYRYGLVVPLLMAYLLSVRWRDRPAPSAEGAPRALWLGVALLMPLVWWIRGANPEWRLIGVALALLAIMAGWAWFGDVGGRSWLRHFAGAVGFFAVGVPWPSGFEKVVTGWLMPANAAITLEALQWLGVPCIRDGNLITLAQGTLGVEEACSGIRSLQACVMIAAFLGELNFLKPPARIVLLLASVGIALVTNILRTIGISLVASHEGLEAARHAHNTAGMLVLLGNALALWGLAHCFQTHRSEPAVASSRAWPRWHPGVTLCLTSILLMGPLVYGWYARNEGPAAPGWNLAEPTAEPGYMSYPIDRRTSVMLRHNQGWSAKWRTSEGQPLHGFYFEWEAGQTPADNMNVHAPGNCLGAMGIQSRGEAEPFVVMLNDRRLTVRLLRFEDAGRPLFIAYLVSSLRQNEDAAAMGSFDYSYQYRLEAVWKGLRNGGQRLIEIGLWDEPSESKAREVFQKLIQAHLREMAPRA